MQTRAARILVDSEAKAMELLAQATSGTAFEELARAHSLCPSKLKAGDLGWFGRGSMVEPFEEAAFALQEGQISQPVPTEFGFHLIKVLARKE